MDSISAAVIESKIKSVWGNDTILGRSPLANILNQDTSKQPLVDISFDRLDDLDESPGGVLLIGTHAPGFAAVEQAPRLPPVVQNRWSALVDGLSVNGENFTFTTQPKLSTVPAGKLAAFMDTGTGLPEVPPEVANFIYSNIPGAVNANGTWFIPCNGGANLTWYLGCVVSDVVRGQPQLTFVAM